jgi:hypothetical protein
MAVREPSCPICHADVPITGDEKTGEEVFCAFCAAPLVVKGKSEEDMELEEDW